jgi:hypothetical protein
MNRFLITYLFLFIFSIYSFSQDCRTIEAHRSNEKIVVDGFFNEAAWEAGNWQQDFFQYEPYNGNKSSAKTLVKIVYDDNSMYVAAICKKDKLKENDILTKRDDYGQSDYFGLYIDPYKTGITGYGFFVTAAGVQVDLKLDNGRKDYNWDAVWYSAVRQTDSAYVIEMRIPYSAFRFPRGASHVWNINFYRNIRTKREIDTWNYVDNSKNGILNQMGQLVGIGRILPPSYLAILPHFAAYIQKYSDINKFPRTYNTGLDIKYGLNESYTLDMMLIPDFGEVQSDDQVLNLSPYETYYNEKRYFFTEGTEIFNKGNIFYSRRIGHKPAAYAKVPNLLHKNEIILDNPTQTSILNATKISGKTKKGIAMGFLTALTRNTYAKIYDTLRHRGRKVLTQANEFYNVSAFSIPFFFNSYSSFTNTFYASPRQKYLSDVWAQEMLLRNRKNSWAFFERFSQSNIFADSAKLKKGFAYRLSLSKTSGNFRISLSRTLYSNTYNPNDVGYLANNNVVTNNLSLAYNIYKPFSYFLNWRNSLSMNRKNLFEDDKYIGTNFVFTSTTKLKNYTSLGLRLNYTPDEVYDYFEPRVEDRFFVQEPKKKITAWISTNYSKAFAYDILGAYYFAKLNQKSQNGFNFIYSPRLQLSNRALFIFKQELRFDNNNVGFVGKSKTQDTVFFGKRNIKYNTQTIEFDYIISKNASLNLRIRHYWSLIDYFEYYSLANNGRLYPVKYSYHFFNNKDINYNSFTADVVFRWIFSPGSEFSIVYKKNITGSSDKIIENYYDNFENFYFGFPHLNSLSFKIILYLYAPKRIMRKRDERNKYN